VIVYFVLKIAFTWKVDIVNPAWRLVKTVTVPKIAPPVSLLTT